ncbi:MAG TPA: cell division protein ZapE [Gammaproteobacteria bacterium]|nr:cell division protein ZapE [Gammaproteobacteria bacterium]
MNPLERYQQDLLRDGFTADPMQRRVVDHLQQLYQVLCHPPAAPRRSWWQELLGKEATPAYIPGLYLWGGVGRGKTHLVDIFHECLPFEEKARVHFHSFMQRIHRELKSLKKIHHPLRHVAQGLAQEARVLCLDEFHVADITDAMLLGHLLRALFEHGVTLVATSNEPPDKLYWGGLQRERFLPAIRLIKAHTRVMYMDNDTDYRLRALEKAEIYHAPLDAAAEQSLRRGFDSVAPEPGKADGALEIEGRMIPTVRQADGVAWFEFEALCGGPRSAADYMEIARCYQTVLLANVPRMDDRNNDAARRFIHLVDEFYDHGVKLIVSAAAQPQALYQGERLAKLFERTQSRLVEMQSKEYLAREHIS